MTAIELHGVGKENKGKSWVLDLTDQAAVLSTQEGQEIQRFAREQAGEQFLLPHFGGEIKHFTIDLGERKAQFKVSRQGLKAIRGFLLQSIADMGPEAVDAMKSAAIRNIAIGIGASAVGIGITVAGYMAAASAPQGGRYMVFYGLILWGVFMLFRGFSLFGTYRRLMRETNDDATYGSGAPMN